MSLGHIQIHCGDMAVSMADAAAADDDDHRNALHTHRIQLRPHQIQAGDPEVRRRQKEQEGQPEEPGLQLRFPCTEGLGFGVL